MNGATPGVPAPREAPSAASSRPEGAAFIGTSARLVLITVVVVGIVFAGAHPLDAQAATGAGSAQMRHFWHVFAAYAIAWILLFGWAVSIARRIRRVEEKLDRDR